MSERIERYAVVSDGRLVEVCNTKETAMSVAAVDCGRVIRLVELRENERITGPETVPWNPAEGTAAPGTSYAAPPIIVNGLPTSNAAGRPPMVMRPMADLGLEERAALPETTLRDQVEAAEHADDVVVPVRTFKVGDRVREIRCPASVGTVSDIKDDMLRIDWDGGPIGAEYLKQSMFEHVRTRLIPERELNAAGRLTATEVSVRAMSSDYESRLEAMTARALATKSALNDAAGKYERETAARLFAADISNGMGAPMSWAIESAAKLRSHYFPPAKEV